MSMTLAPELENVLLRFGVFGSRRLMHFAVLDVTVVSLLTAVWTNTIPADDGFSSVGATMCHERTHSSDENVVALSVVGQQ